MHITTIHLGETSIELYNSFWGRETVKVNGELVSSKYSFSGMEHIFFVNESGGEATYKLKTGLGLFGMYFNLYKNDLPVIESPRTKGWFSFFLVIIIMVILVDLLAGLISGS